MGVSASVRWVPEFVLAITRSTSPHKPERLRLSVYQRRIPSPMINLGAGCEGVKIP
jgi:hypothetical protein